MQALVFVQTIICISIIFCLPVLDMFKPYVRCIVSDIIFSFQLTIAGKTAFSPTLMRFQDPCYHESYTDLALKKVIWQDDGPGIMAMYKSDWTRVGGKPQSDFVKVGSNYSCDDESNFLSFFIIVLFIMLPFRLFAQVHFYFLHFNLFSLCLDKK